MFASAANRVFEFRSVEGFAVATSWNAGQSLMVEARTARFLALDDTITPIPNLVRFPRDEDEEAVRVPFYDDAHYYQRGLALLRDQPSRLVERGASNMVEAAGIGRQGYWPQPDTRLTRMHRRAFFIAALLPSLAGALLLAARRRWATRENLALLAAAGLVLSNLVTVFFFLGDPRMRVPFDPLVLLLAAAGYLWLGELLQERWAALLRLRRPRETLDQKS